MGISFMFAHFMYWKVVAYQSVTQQKVKFNVLLQVATKLQLPLPLLLYVNYEAQLCLFFRRGETHAHVELIRTKADGQ